MTLSIVIPAHNAASHLDALIDSLLPQCEPGDELIVVDDASADATQMLLATYPRVLVLRHATNRGVGAARNSGAASAKGDLLVFLDADTISAPDLLAAIRAFFGDHPDVAAASGVYAECNGGTDSFSRYLDLVESAMRSPALDRPAPGTLSGSLCAIRREVFVASGGFAEDRRFALEDIELGLRLTRAGHAHWLIGDWRVMHRQPCARNYLCELVPRTRHYLALLRQFRDFNEVMGGKAEGWGRLCYALALFGLAGLALFPGTTAAGMAVTVLATAARMNRAWLVLTLRREGWGFLPVALAWHAATTAAICLGGLLGAFDGIKYRLWRYGIDVAVVLAYLRSLIWPGAGGYLIQFLTHRCPARCGHCFDHPQRKVADAQQELDTARIARIARSAPPLGHVSLTGGEPLLRDDLPEILVAWHAAGVRSISLSTSGAYPNRLIDTLQRALPLMPWLRLIVTLSVDAQGARHDTLRGLSGLFRHVECCLSRLQTLRTTWPQLRVHACLTLSANNAADAETTLEWLARWNFDQIELNALRGATADPACRRASPAAYDRLRTHLAKLNAISTGLSALFARLDAAMFDIVRRWHEPWPCGGCLAGRRLAVVLADGTVLPCEMLQTIRAADAPAYGNFVLGRLNEHGDDLARLLNSDKVRLIRAYIKEKECRCSFECAIFATLAYRPWRVPALWLGKSSGKHQVAEQVASKS